MTSTQSLTDPALAAVAEADAWARQAEVAKLVAVLDWAGAHEVAGALVQTPGLRLGGLALTRRRYPPRRPLPRTLTAEPHTPPDGRGHRRVRRCEAMP